jgi:hypothetical protein
MIKLPKFDNLAGTLSKLSKREKMVLPLAVFALSAWLIDMVVVKPLLKKNETLDAQIAAREAEIRKDMRIMAQKRRIEIQQATYRPYVGAQSSENEEFTILLKEVDTLARDNKVYVVDLKPTGTKVTADSTKYLVNLNIEAEAGDLVRFMYALEDSKKLMTVEKYQITPKSGDSQTAKCSLLISKLVIPQ